MTKPLAAFAILLLLAACGGQQNHSNSPAVNGSSGYLPPTGGLPISGGIQSPIIGGGGSSGGSSSGDAYNITLNFAPGSDPRVVSAMKSAAARWEGVITQGLPSSNVTISANACGPNAVFSGNVDDILVFTGSVDIDGPGGVLAQSGPCSVRSASGLTVYSILMFDNADLNEMASQLPSVALHELGHSLGIGSLWKKKGLTTGAGTSDPRYTGTGGKKEYAALGGTLGDVPEENQGGRGTIEGHWRETTFGSELMTGYLNRGSVPLSRLTIASLQDLGYSVDFSRADAYSASTINTLDLGDHLDIGSREIVIEPKFEVQ